MMRPNPRRLRIGLRCAAVAAILAIATSAAGAETTPATVLGEAAGRIDGGAEICGQGECPLGTLVAEAMRAHALASAPAPDATAPAQAASVAGGIVAAGVPAEALRGALAEGPVTPAALDAALPGGERLVEIEVIGAALLAALEHGAATIGSEPPRLLQVAGLRYAVDPGQPPGQRIAEVRLWREAGTEFIRHGTEWNLMHRSARWIRLDPAARYRLVTTDAVTQGASGFSMLAGTGTEGPPLTEVVAAYLRARSPYAPVQDGRIALR